MLRILIEPLRKIYLFLGEYYEEDPLEPKLAALRAKANALKIENAFLKKKVPNKRVKVKDKLKKVLIFMRRAKKIIYALFLSLMGIVMIFFTIKMAI